MKRQWLYYGLLILGTYSCASQGRIVSQGDEYDDVYLADADTKRALAGRDKKISENEALPDQYNNETNPKSNFSNPDSWDYPISGGSLYTPLYNQSANWKNYNSWSMPANSTCWSCSNWNWGMGWNTWNCYGWSSPCWTSWNNPYWYNTWANPYWSFGWGNTWYVGYSWNAWNQPWGVWNTWTWNDYRAPKFYQAPRLSAERGTTFLRNTPAPRTQLTTSPKNSDSNNFGSRNLLEGSVRNFTNSTSAYQNNENRSGRLKRESKNIERHFNTEDSNNSRWFNRDSWSSSGGRERSILGNTGGSSGSRVSGRARR